jgi:membrane associated rhomboid family serine protease
MVGTIILINAAICVADVFFTPETRGGAGRWLSDTLAVHVATLTQPWLWWRFLTYGFAHSPATFRHILFNMLGLWFLGKDIEYTYGRKEFLRIYLVLLVVGGLVWTLVNRLQGHVEGMAYGASGAVAGIVVLYALNFPRRTLLLFFVLPVPAWLCGVLLVAGDIYGAFSEAGQTHVAYTIHLAGAAFAFLYYQQRWNLGRLVEGRLLWPRLRRRPKLRVHRPERPQFDLSQQVDRILEKIHREGESSLTRKERQILEDASREYQKRRRE